MPGLFPVTLAEQIACVERELRLRERVYARRVAEKRMSRAIADREIEHMGAVLATLRALEAQGKRGKSLERPPRVVAVPDAD